MIVATVRDASAARPGRPLFTGLNIALRSGDRLGVVGINGSGKTTLLQVLAGTRSLDGGSIEFAPGLSTAVLGQDPDLGRGTVREAVGHGWKGEAAIDRLGLGALAEAQVETLSGGQAKRAALARALVEPADLLILDEPTNHLDVPAIAWLEDQIREHRGCVVLVSHDRVLLEATTTRIIELDQRGTHVHGGGYQHFVEVRAAREAAAETSEAVRRNLARRELEWLRRGPKARGTKSKARSDRAIALQQGPSASGVRSGELQLHTKTPRLGGHVLELESVGHAYGGAQPLFRNVDVLLGPGDRLGLVGGNGTGKTTLLDIIAGRLEPLEGTVTRGQTVVLGYHDQTGRTLDVTQRVEEAVVGDRAEIAWWDRQLMEQFWFDRDAQRARIGSLSGGERRRLQLVLTLAQHPNVLLLDEPTNDLDIDTLRALEEFLDAWPGTLIVSSHDRAFLERTVDDVVMLDGRSAKRLPGGVAAWLELAGAQPLETGERPVPEPAATTSGLSKAERVSMRRELKDVERKLAAAERRVERGRAAFEGVTDPAELAELGRAFKDAELDVAELEERWLELSADLEARAAGP